MLNRVTVLCLDTTSDKRFVEEFSDAIFPVAGHGLMNGDRSADRSVCPDKYSGGQVVVDDCRLQ